MTQWPMVNPSICSYVKCYVKQVFSWVPLKHSRGICANTSFMHGKLQLKYKISRYKLVAELCIAKVHKRVAHYVYVTVCLFHHILAIEMLYTCLVTWWMWPGLHFARATESRVEIVTVSLARPSILNSYQEKSMYWLFSSSERGFTVIFFQ